MSLDQRDVQELLKLLDESPYDALTLNTGRFTLQLQRSADGKAWQQSSSVAAGTAQPVALASAAPVKTVQEAAPTAAGLLEVRAPMVGTFYRAPKPGAEPFIALGSSVQPDSVIGIIEVMKLMSSIPAGVHGKVVEIHAEDAMFVEKGQLLLRVEPGSA